MYLFIITHLGSGSSLLCDSLSKHRHFLRSKQETYKHAFDVLKMKTSYSKVYFDKIEFNHQFTCQSLHKQCKFIYLIREPKPSLNYIMKIGYSSRGAYNYYTYRLRRIYEMLRKTPDSILITFDDLASGRAFEMIRKNIGFKHALDIPVLEEQEYDVPYQLLTKAQERYEYYLSRYLHDFS